MRKGEDLVVKWQAHCRDKGPRHDRRHTAIHEIRNEVVSWYGVISAYQMSKQLSPDEVLLCNDENATDEDCIAGWERFELDPDMPYYHLCDCVNTPLMAAVYYVTVDRVALLRRNQLRLGQ